MKVFFVERVLQGSRKKEARWTGMGVVRGYAVEVETRLLGFWKGCSLWRCMMRYDTHLLQRRDEK